MVNSNVLTLYELNSLVREVIDTTLCQRFWVKAELSEIRVVRGHCYMELVQKDDYSPTPVARASAKCWHNTWARLQPRFEQVTGQPLRAGMSVLLQVTANFHEAYGFAWIVQDIDPTYTLGDMARKRLEIVKQLKDEGVFDMQKGLRLPSMAQRVAVISSEQAAGYGDFCNQLDNNEYGLRLSHELFPAVMQGEQVENTVIQALNLIFDRADDFDVVVIIRGGGATADMSGFDTLALAEHVANFPLPIITGIGHERDESVIDMVSFLRVKTPTAAAAFLVSHLADTWHHIVEIGSQLARLAHNRLETEQSRVQTVAMRLSHRFAIACTQRIATLDSLERRLLPTAQKRLTAENNTMRQIVQRLLPIAKMIVANKRNELDCLEVKINAADPKNILRKGYSITLHNGKALHNVLDVKPGDTLFTKLANGQIVSTVNKTSQQKN